MAESEKTDQGEFHDQGDNVKRITLLINSN
jgi:hypothetical protein